MVKKFLSIVAATIMGACLFCGCGDSDEDDYLNYSGEIEEKPFYTLKEAYDYGWLSKSDLKSIAYYHNGGVEGNESVMNKSYTPKLKTPEELDDITTAKINQEYCDIHNLKGYFPEITVDQVGFSYYGCYNGCAVIKISYDNMAVSDVLGEENLGGIKVFYTDGLRLSVWKQKEI